MSKPFTYFAYSKSLRRWKIGRSSQPSKRIASISNIIPDVQLALAVPFSIVHESDAHGRFAEFKIAGEWFRDCPEIRSFVKKHKVTHMQCHSFNAKKNREDDGKSYQFQVSLSGAPLRFFLGLMKKSKMNSSQQLRSIIVSLINEAKP